MNDVLVFMFLFGIILLGGSLFLLAIAVDIRRTSERVRANLETVRLRDQSRSLAWMRGGANAERQRAHTGRRRVCSGVRSVRSSAEDVRQEVDRMHRRALVRIWIAALTALAGLALIVWSLLSFG